MAFMATKAAIGWLSAASLAVGVYGTVKSGQAQEKNLVLQARAEKSSAKTREVSRKRNLINALALQNVRGAASGIRGGAGSSEQAIMMEDIRKAGVEGDIDVAATGQRTTQLMENASNIRKYSLLSASGEAAEYIVRRLERGKTKKET